MANKLTAEERNQVAFKYERCNSVIEVQRWWRKTHGNHTNLNYRTIRNCHERLLHTGSSANRKRQPKTNKSKRAENIDTIREILNESPEKSVRQLKRECELDVSESTIFKIVKKELKFRPWKPHYVQKLEYDDNARRLMYANHMDTWLNEEPALLENILWSDEAVFCVGGFVNRKNCHYWSDVNPHMTVERTQHRPKVTVWCGFTASRIVGPFFIRDTMDAARYLAMLEEDVWPVLSRWRNVDRLVFMQDGAPAHYSRVVRNWLDRHFHQRWLGRAGPNEWPARSPDLTPCDFFLWGYVKEEVYKRQAQNIDELEAYIREVIENIPREYIKASCLSVRERLEKLRRNGGGHIEY